MATNAKPRVRRMDQPPIASVFMFAHHTGRTQPSQRQNDSPHRVGNDTVEECNIGGLMVKLFQVSLAVPLVLASFSRSGAADWPNWRGPHHDGISRETGLLKTWPDKKGPKLLWEGKLTGGYSSLVVAGGRVFTQTKDEEKKQEVIVCLDADTGKPLWEYRYHCDYVDHPSLDKRFL